MTYRVWIDDVAEQTVAAARMRVAQSEIAKVFGGALDKVWDFVRAHEGLRTDGHNVFIYRQKDSDSADGKLTIEFGVQITRSFAGEGDVICTSTQAGRVATTLHVGPYDRLSEAHAAIQGWCAENGYAPAGVD
jgi:effector-binding domain-containing protein